MAFDEASKLSAISLAFGRGRGTAGCVLMVAGINGGRRGILC
jgi:hypothetical protein